MYVNLVWFGHTLLRVRILIGAWVLRLGFRAFEAWSLRLGASSLGLWVKDLMLLFLGLRLESVGFVLEFSPTVGVRRLGVWALGLGHCGFGLEIGLGPRL